MFCKVQLAAHFADDTILKILLAWPLWGLRRVFRVSWWHEQVTESPCPGSHAAVTQPSPVDTLPEQQDRGGLWSQSFLRAAPCPDRGWVSPVPACIGNGILRASPTSESSSEAKRWQGEQGTSSLVLLAARAGLAPSPQLLSSLAQSPILCRAAPSSSCRPRNSRKAPASFSEVVGEFFIFFIFFLIVWWLLLPLAQDFLASAQGELALNGKCNRFHCKLAVKLTEGR